MKDNKIYVDALPCKISWTTPLLLLCIVVYISAIVLCKLGGNGYNSDGAPDLFTSIALGGVILSAILWVVFFALFANACRLLPYKISTATMLTALSGAIMFVSNSIYILYSSLTFAIVSIVASLFLLGSALWLGNILSRNYSGVLQEIGVAMKKIVKLIAFSVIIMLITLIAGGLFGALIRSESIVMFVGYFTGFCELVLWVWAMWIMLDDIILPIYQMLNWGHQEGVTHNDIKNCLTSRIEKI